MCIVDKIKVDGIIMNYARFGNGSKSFVILPGLSVKNTTESAKAVKQAYKLLECDYTVYLFDRRQNVPQKYSLENMAYDTLKVMDYLNIKKSDFFGASQGGMIAMYIAILYPDVVNKLILGSTACQMTEMSKVIFDNWIYLAIKGDKSKLSDCFAKDIYSPNIYNKFKKIFYNAGNDFTQEELSRFIILAKSMYDIDIAQKICTINPANTLVIGSKGDKVFGSESSVFIANTIGCECYIYENAYGHAVFDEAKDYVERIDCFLKK